MTGRNRELSLQFYNCFSSNSEALTTVYLSKAAWELLFQSLDCKQALNKCCNITDLYLYRKVILTYIGNNSH